MIERSTGCCGVYRILEVFSSDQEDYKIEKVTPQLSSEIPERLFL